MIGSPHFLGVQPRLVLADVDERTNDDVLAVVGDEPRRHRLERAGEEQVQQQRLDEVVEVMAERDLGGADFGRDPVEHAAAQPRAERARRGVGLEDVVHDLADRGVLDAVFPAALLAGLGDDVVLEVLVAGVDVDRDEREVGWARACRRLSSVCISAQLSLPPDRPTMTRSPSSIRLKSVMALVVFLAMRASSGLR